MFTEHLRAVLSAINKVCAGVDGNDHYFCEDMCLQLKPVEEFDIARCEAIGYMQCQGCYQDLLATEWDREVSYRSQTR